MMNVRLVALLLLTIGSTYGVPSTYGEPQESDTTRELKRIQEQLATTWKNGDCDAWGGFLAADWSVIHITGEIITKSEALQMCRGSRPPIESLAADDLAVRSYGDAAVVRGRTTMITGGQNPQTVRLRFTDVFIRRAGRWQAVASHATRLDQ
jgi:hypothetical protein